MISDKDEIDLGLVITKSPFESSLVEGALMMATDAVARGNSLGIFLISDGVLLVKRGQRSPAAEQFAALLESCDTVIASKAHLEAAGISSDEMLEHIIVSENTYDDLVDHVMEKWNRVISI